MMQSKSKAQVKIYSSPYVNIRRDQPSHHPNTPSWAKTIATSATTAHHWMRMPVQKNGRAIRRMNGYGIHISQQWADDDTAARVCSKVTITDTMEKARRPIQ